MEKVFIIEENVKFTEGGVTFNGALAYVPKRHDVVPMCDDGQMDEYVRKFNVDWKADNVSLLIAYVNAKPECEYTLINTSDDVPFASMSYPIYEDATTGTKLHCLTPAMDDSMQYLDLDSFGVRVGMVPVSLISAWVIERVDEDGDVEACFATTDMQEANELAVSRMREHDGFFYRVMQY